MRLTIRHAKRADRDDLLVFMAELQEEERRLHVSRLPGNEMAERHFTYLERLVRDHQGLVLVADEVGMLQGFLIGLVERHGGFFVRPEYERFGYVSDLFVSERARGRGIARQLLDSAATYFRQLGLRHMQIAYLNGNDAAERAYRKSGFTPLYTGLTRDL